MKRITPYTIFLGILTLSGCMNLTTRLQPEDATVKATHEGKDCVPIIFGIGIGTATVEKATKEGQSIAAKEQALIDRKPRRDVPLDPIGRMRILQFTDYGFLGFGARCIEVTGEAAGAVKTSAK